MKLSPTNDRVIVKIKKEDSTDSGIFIGSQETFNQGTTLAEVLEVGQPSKDNTHGIEPKKGEIVHIEKYSGDLIDDHDDHEIRVVNYKEVVAVQDGHQKKPLLYMTHIKTFISNSRLSGLIIYNKDPLPVVGRIISVSPTVAKKFPHLKPGTGVVFDYRKNTVILDGNDDESFLHQDYIKAIFHVESDKEAAQMFEVTNRAY